MASSELLLSCLFARCHMHWMEESFTTKTEEQLYHTVGVVSLFTLPRKKKQVVHWM